MPLTGRLTDVPLMLVSSLTETNDIAFIETSRIHSVGLVLKIFGRYVWCSRVRSEIHASNLSSPVQDEIIGRGSACPVPSSVHSLIKELYSNDIRDA